MGGDISCEINYYGPICQKCQKFFSKSLIDDVCEKCDSFKNTILGLQDRSFFIFSTIYYLSSIVDSLTNFIFSFRMQFSSLEKEKSGIQGLISSHLKQLINIMQMLNVVNFIRFTNHYDSDSNFLPLISDFLSGSFSRIFSLDCLLFCKKQIIKGRDINFIFF